MVVKSKADLIHFVKKIESVDKNTCKKTKNYLDCLIKPIGSLGKLEEICITLSGITGKIKNNINKKCVIIMCSDNGVVEEGVASTPQYITLLQTKNFIKNNNGVGVLAKHTASDLLVVDVGINSDEIIQNVYNKKIRKGTSNIAKGAAMSYNECIEAINIGIEMARVAKENNYDIIGVGEMGIGNTTTSSCVLMCLTECSINVAVGKGAGLTDENFIKKKEIITKALKVNNVDNNDVIDILSKVSGFDIAGMTGIFLGAAYYKLPAVIDGFISLISALCAVKLCPLVKDYLLTSHYSEEIGFKIAIKELGIEPFLHLNMRLGEGSGCPLAFSIIESACAIINNMSTFESANVDTKYLDKLK